MVLYPQPCYNELCYKEVVVYDIRFTYIITLIQNYFVQAFIYLFY